MPAQLTNMATDSRFIHLEGRTKHEAFRIGEEIVSRVTEWGLAGHGAKV